MPFDNNISRRFFLKSGSAVLGAACAGAVAPLSTALAGGELDNFEYESSAFTTCDMCFNRCGAIARLRGGRVVKLDPNPDFTKSRGMLCGRGAAGMGQLYDRDRLREPLLRVGKRGEGKWKPVSWNYALDLAAEKFLDIAKRYTRCGVVFSFGSDMQTTFANRFAAAFGSHNVTTQESLCLFSTHRAYLDTFGEIPMPDLRHARYVLMPGSNRFESLVTPDTSDLMEMLQEGGKLCVVDPRCTKTAALATDWLQIRAGTDLALGLALIHVIITEKLYNAAWVDEHTFGLDRLAVHVADRTPAWAEEETGLSAERIVAVAREMAAAAPRALVYPGRRTSDYADSTQIRRGWAILNALLGNFDCQGGLMVPSPFRVRGIPLKSTWYDDNPAKRLDESRIPLPFKEEASFEPLRDGVISGKPYPTAGWFVFKTNPMQTAPDQAKTLAMIDKMEFIATVDILMSDTAFMSDLVLPAHTYMERDDPCQVLAGGPAGPCLVWRKPVVAPLYDTRNPFDIFKSLSQRMGLEEHFNFSVDDFRAAQVKSLGPNAEAAQRDLEEKGVYIPNVPVYGLYEGKSRYKTSSKKIDIWSGLYEKRGQAPLPEYKRPKQGEGFRLIAGRTALTTQASSQNNAILAVYVPTNTLDINPLAAEELGIKDDDMVEVSSIAGKARLRARLDPGIERGCVHMLTGFGTLSPQMSLTYKNGACIAALMEDAMDSISGNAAHHETFVTVKKVGKA